MVKSKYSPSSRTFYLGLSIPIEDLDLFRIKIAIDYSKSTMETKDKVALITGGTHGIGREIALLLAQGGAHIAVIARNPPNEETKESIKRLGVRFLAVQADLHTSASCENAVAAVLQEMGSIDIFIHCAGGAAPGSLLEVNSDTWHHAFDIHIHALFNISRAVVPGMKEKQEGNIVIISSAAGIRGVRNAIAYSVVKGALPQMCRSMALELSADNIKVNCISPGVIRTRFQDYLSEEQAQNNINNRIPLRREGTGKDVAEAALMLIKNNFITGEKKCIHL